jgi:very-short-patch-repair endonuclease
VIGDPNQLQAVHRLQKPRNQQLLRKANTFEPGQLVFESPWERKFYEALATAGIKPVTQYPLAGRRLDLAIIDAKLDIEVDGERYHRDEAGRRKAEDLWRDIAVRAVGCGSCWTGGIATPSG